MQLFKIRCWLIIIVGTSTIGSERPRVCRTDQKCKQICAGADLRCNWASMNESVDSCRHTQFKTRGPIVCGVPVEAGYVRVGTPLCVPMRECIALCTVLPIEVNNKSIDLLSRPSRSLHQDQKHNRRGAAHGHSSVVSRFSSLHWTSVWRRVPSTPIRHRWLVVARTILLSIKMENIMAPNKPTPNGPVPKGVSLCATTRQQLRSYNQVLINHTTKLKNDHLQHGDK